MISTRAELRKTLLSVAGFSSTCQSTVDLNRSMCALASSQCLTFELADSLDTGRLHGTNPQSTSDSAIMHSLKIRGKFEGRNDVSWDKSASKIQLILVHSVSGPSRSVATEIDLGSG